MYSTRNPIHQPRPPRIDRIPILHTAKRSFNTAVCRKLAHGDRSTWTRIHSGIERRCLPVQLRSRKLNIAVTLVALDATLRPRLYNLRVVNYWSAELFCSQADRTEDNQDQLAYEDLNGTQRVPSSRPVDGPGKEHVRHLSSVNEQNLIYHSHSD